MSSMRPGLPERGSDADLFKELERRISNLETAARLPLSSIGEGGITIIDGGQIQFVDDVEGVTVVIDSTGLYIDGIKQPALAILDGTETSNPTVTTTPTTVNEVTLNIPDWADEVTLFTMARLQVSNISGATQNMNNILVNDVGGLDETTDDTWTIPNNETLSSFVALTTTVMSPGATITCRQRASTTGGSHGGEARLEVMAIVRRTT